jgi:hypothetical protein
MRRESKETNEKESETEKRRKDSREIRGEPVKKRHGIYF